MARIVVLLAILLLGYLLWNELKKRSAKQRRQLILRGTLFGLVGIFLVLAATGRVHWIMAALAAAIPFAKVLFSLVLRAFPFLQVWMKHRQQAEEQTTTLNPSGEFNEEEAWQLLGLEPSATREQIIQAHKRLIQKLHPDRGGNDYLASKLNAARDLLLKKYR